MANVADIIRAALGHLRVIDAMEAVEAEDSRDAIQALNRMMRRWEADGVNLGWSDVDNPDDLLPAPPEAEEAIGYNLALRLRANYGATLDQDVVQFAQDGLASLKADCLRASPLHHGAALPCAEAGNDADALNGWPRR